MNNSSDNKINVIKPSLPKGGGDLTGLGETFSPHEFSGASSLSFPIPATPCRNFAPQVSINYSSGNGNGPFGLGYELSLPEISRQTSKSIPKYDDTDTFLYTGDDYLVPELDVNGVPVTTSKTINKVKGNPVTYTVDTFRPRVAGAFDIIERYTKQDHPADVFWIVTQPDNTTSIFGKSDDAKIYDPQNKTHIFKWLLEETFDAKGNHQIFKYQREDGQNIPDSSLTINRDTSAQIYLSKIKYGNYLPITGSILLNGHSGTHWHFEIVFDYGQYDIDPGNTTPYDISVGNQWSCRQDPFSDYRSGFDIRTYRLCQNVLLFHRFPKQEYKTDKQVLTKVLSLSYEQSPLLTLLTQVQSKGYYYTSGATPPYEAKSLPPLTLGYSSFQPNGPGYVPHDYESVSTADGENLVGLSRAPNCQLVDLYGGGIPGVLYNDGQTVRYQSLKAVSEQGVVYNNASDISFPLSRSSNDATHTLTDITGNGSLDLLVSTPGQAGFYETNADGTWNDWQALEAFPTDFHNALQQHVDVTGEGLADLLLIEQNQVRVYPSAGALGYCPALTKQRPEGLPISTANEPKSMLTFAVMCGLGPAQLVRIANGLVECWPNLGYGSFGDRVAMTNSPNFGQDFDTARLRLTDLDGSGTTDLAYIYSDHVKIYLNQSGNSFAATPISIPLPASWDSLDQIQFSDVPGNGTQCLVFSTAHPRPRQWYYDFNQTQSLDLEGNTQTISQKPYLLTETLNNLGALTMIRYASSTKFYLQNRQDGLDWVTPLPFPVNVIESVTHVDQIANTHTVSSYQYHHGYYDGYEREFRGFGRVDRTDAKFFADFIPDPSADAAAYNAAPIVTKTWYHTGAWLKEADLLVAFRNEYWSGDRKFHELPPTHFKFIASSPDADTLREAHRSLHGQILRSEVYGKDGTPWQDAPYTVSETQMKVSELQEKGPNKYDVFLVHDRESISYDYERNANDPRISHHFVLKIDHYGHVLQSASVSYGRRSQKKYPTELGLDPQTKKQQQQIHIMYEEKAYINSTDPGFYISNPIFYLLGMPLENKSYEITGLPLANGYFTFSEIYEKIQSATKKLLHWERDYYLDAASQKELPLEEITAQALHHRTEFVEFNITQLNTDLKDTVISDLSTLMASGGYIIPDASDPDYTTAQNYYWNPGSSQSYDSANFYLPNAFFDPFQYQFIYHGTSTSDLTNVPKTVYNYDTYNLLVQQVSDPLENTTNITKIDYQHVVPTQIQDINGNTSEVLFDPLGMVIATSFYGTDYNGSSGFSSLCSATNPYNIIDSPTLTDVMDNPIKYLQNAASYFYYDLESWTIGTPAHFATLTAEEYPQNDTQNGPIQKTITYSDGFGRHLQSKAFLDSAETVHYRDPKNATVVPATVNSCWLTSGAVRYDDKGQPIQQYEPYFAPDYTYVDEQELNQVGYSSTIFYDSLGREALTVSPEGFLAKTLFGVWSTENTGIFSGYLNTMLYGSLPKEFVPSPWSSLHFDENDTVEDSACYKTYKQTGTSPSSDVDGASLDKAVFCFNTPMITYDDSLGRTVQNGQFNVSSNEQNTTYLKLDILGNQLKSTDQRLHSANQAPNFRMKYSLSNDPITSISADAGTTWALKNVVGNPFWSYDSRGTTTTRTFDVLQRPASVYVDNKSGAVDPLNLNQTVEYVVYGDSQDSTGVPFFQTPESLNLRGKAVITFDQSGLDLSPFYTIHGHPQAAGKVLNSDYKNEVKWDSITDQTIAAIVTAIGSTVATPADLYSLDASTLKISELEDALYALASVYDALGRLTQSTDPDDNTTSSQYYRTGWLKSTTVTAGTTAQNAATAAGTTVTTPGISKIRYNAKGQHTTVVSGNGITTKYTYDTKNFRLLNIKSTRSSKPKTIQDLSYHHDPVGNVTSLTDNSIPTVFFKNEKVEPKSDYNYDTLYRLVTATGREHRGMWQNLQNNQNNIGALAGMPTGAQPTSNGKALQNYKQTYAYDDSGNLTEMRHCTQSNKFTRKITIDTDSNRIAGSTVGQTQPAIYYSFDLHGNQLTLGGLTSMQWNYRDNMQSATVSTSDVEYYVYDAGGRRVRKVRETQVGSGANVTESIYLGSYEIRRNGQKQGSDPTTYTEQWHWTNVADCRWGYLTDGTAKNGALGYQLRYQLTNHLESCTMELDETANVITYEEYYPYGGTAIIAATSQTEVKQKYYRYSGKEEDDATGLYYYGMRYYCPWLSRWTCTDPAGTIDGLNLYAFVGGNPVTHVDVGGMVLSEAEQTRRLHIYHKLKTEKDKKEFGEEYLNSINKAYKYAITFDKLDARVYESIHTMAMEHDPVEKKYNYDNDFGENEKFLTEATITMDTQIPRDIGVDADRFNNIRDEMNYSFKKAGISEEFKILKYEGGNFIKVSRGELNRADVINNLFRSYYDDMTKDFPIAMKDSQKVERIALLHKQLGYLEAFRDGNTRTNLIVLRKLMADEDLSPSIVKEPKHSKFKTLKHWAKNIKKGQKRWKRKKYKKAKGWRGNRFTF